MGLAAHTDLTTQHCAIENVLLLMPLQHSVRVEDQRLKFQILTRKLPEPESKGDDTDTLLLRNGVHHHLGHVATI